MKYSKLKYNYHDASLLSYRWSEDDLILEVESCKCGKHDSVSEVRFYEVKNKVDVIKVLDEIFSRPLQASNISGFHQTDKQEYSLTVFNGTLKVCCKSILEI